MPRTYIPNDPAIFPAAPRWLAWTGRPVWDVAKQEYGAGKDGQIKTFMSLYEAKKSLNWIGTNSKYREEEQRGRFMVDWSIYEWTGEEWIERYSGLEGQRRSDHPLWKRGAISKEEQVPAIQRSIEDAAIRSILEAGVNGSGDA